MQSVKVVGFTRRICLFLIFFDFVVLFLRPASSQAGDTFPKVGSMMGKTGRLTTATPNAKSRM